MIFHSDVPQHPVMGPALVWLPEGRCSDLPSSRWAVPGHAPASAEAEHSGAGAALSRAVMSGAGGRAVSWRNCFGRKQAAFASSALAPLVVLELGSPSDRLCFPRLWNICPGGGPGRRCVGVPSSSPVGSADGEGPGTDGISNREVSSYRVVFSQSDLP